MNNHQPAVGYLRRSSDRQEQSILDQQRVIDAYALANGFDLIDYYVDDAISGASAENRDAFQELIADANSNACPFKFVLVYDIKRFGRVDNDEAGYYRYQLHRNGIEIIYVSEGFNGDDTDDLLRPVKQWQARQELKDLSKVTIRGLLTRVDGGWWAGGTPPYGYDLAYYTQAGEFLCTLRFMQDGSKQVLDEDGNLTRVIPKGDRLQSSKQDRSRLIPSHPDRIKVVRQIFDWYVLEGIGYKSITNRLNQMGIPSPRSKQNGNGIKPKWSANTMFSMLQNPVYVGDMVWNRRSFAKFHRIADQTAVATRYFPGHGPVRNGEEDWITKRDTHQAIITRTQFAKVQARRKKVAKNGNNNTYNVGRGARSPYLLTGLVHCSRCGHRWSGYTSNSGRKRKDGSNIKTLYYACGGYVSKGNSVCERYVIRKEWLENLVLDKIQGILKEYFGSKAGMKKIRKLVEMELEMSLPEIGNELNSVDERLKNIRITINNLIENISADNKQFVDQRIREFKREIAVLEAKKYELEAAGSKRVEMERLIDQAVEMSKDFDTVFEEGTIEEKRLIIRGFLNRVDVDPESRRVEASINIISQNSVSVAECVG